MPSKDVFFGDEARSRMLAGVNVLSDAVKATLAEDAEDLTAFELREPEPDLPFESVVKDLKRRGKV